jgi:hypothetical protein
VRGFKMANQAEELSSWYLRLNGFFLVENFVVHKETDTEAKDAKHTVDVDLLAVRFPNSEEEIGAKLLQCDDEVLFKFVDKSKTLALIVEVKSSEEPEKIKLFYSPYKMRYALRRIGLLEKGQIDALVTNLRKWKVSDEILGEKGFQIGKLLIHNWKRETTKGEEAFKIELGHAKDFILRRFRENDVAKWADRIFFPSNLMQEYISEVRRNR